METLLRNSYQVAALCCRLELMPVMDNDFIHMLGQWMNQLSIWYNRQTSVSTAAGSFELMTITFINRHVLTKKVSQCSNFNTTVPQITLQAGNHRVLYFPVTGKPSHNNHRKIYPVRMTATSLVKQNDKLLRFDPITGLLRVHRIMISTASVKMRLLGVQG